MARKKKEQKEMTLEEGMEHGAFFDYSEVKIYCYVEGTVCCI